MFCVFFSSEVPVTSHHLNPMSLTVAAYCLTNISIRRRRWCGIVIDGYNWSVSFLDHDSLLVLATVLGYKSVFNDWSNRRHGMYVHWNCLPIYSLTATGEDLLTPSWTFGCLENVCSATSSSDSMTKATFLKVYFVVERLEGYLLLLLLCRGKRTLVELVLHNNLKACWFYFNFKQTFIL